MNWYKLSQERAFNLSNTGGSLYWIDPNGVMYKVKHTHFSWTFDNEDFLAKRYDIYFPPSEQKGLWSREGILFENGWIRVRHEDSWYFEIHSLSNIQQLRIIEEKLFNALSPTSDETIVIEGTDVGDKIIFKWNEYIESGINFVDYVKENIQYSKM